MKYLILVFLILYSECTFLPKIKKDTSPYDFYFSATDYECTGRDSTKLCVVPSRLINPKCNIIKISRHQQMSNCIFCKHREIEAGKTKCTSRKGISNAELGNRIKWSSSNTDLHCNGFRENELSGIFNRLNSGLDAAIELLKKL